MHGNHGTRSRSICRSACRSGWAVALALGLSSLTTTAAQAGKPELPEQAARAMGLASARYAELRVNRGRGGKVDVTIPGDASPLHFGRLGRLELEPVSVRSKDYRLLIEQADGSLKPAKPGPERTYRGSVVGKPGSVVAATIDDAGVKARIRFENGDELWIDPLSRRIDGAGANEHAVYEPSDVAASDDVCAGNLGEANLDAEPVALEQDVAAATGPNYSVAEIAIDADSVYFQRYGSVEAVEQRVNDVINAVNLQFERDVAITHEITAVVIRMPGADPYTETDPVQRLYQVRNYWRANHANIPRDLVHHFTGVNLDGAVVGVGFLGGVCNSYSGYALSQSDASSNWSIVTDITAHELGHNWNANHCSCSSNTMNANITGSNAFSEAYTVGVIASFRDSCGCLHSSGDAAPAPEEDPAPTPDPTPPAAPSGLAASSMGPDSIDLGWNDNATDESDYFVDRSTDGVNWSRIATLGAGSKSYRDKNLMPERTYLYRVCASNNAGVSEPSNTAEATTEPESLGETDSSASSELARLDLRIGSWAGGDLPELGLSDDKYFRAASADRGRMHSVEFEAAVLVDSASLQRSLRPHLEIGGDTSNAKITVEILDPRRGRWANLGKFDLSSEDQRLTLGELTNADRYVDRKSGEMTIRIVIEARSNQAPTGFTARIDRFALLVGP